MTIEYNGLPALLWYFIGDVAHLGCRGLFAIADAAGWVLGLVWSTACALGRAVAFPFRVGRLFFYGQRSSLTLGHAIEAVRTVLPPSPPSYMCAFCGRTVAATVTGCPDHGGQEAAGVMARLMRENAVSAEEMQRGLNVAAQWGPPPDSGGEVQH